MRSRMFGRSPRWGVTFSTLSCFLGCSGSISGSGPGAGPDDPPAQTDSSDDETPIAERPGDAPLVPPSSEPLAGLEDLACPHPDAIVPGPLVQARLTRAELDATLRSLFAQAELALPELRLPEEARVDGFLNNVVAQTPASALVEQFADHAYAIAEKARIRLDRLAPCPSGDEVTCGAAFINRFGAQAFRRGLAEDERTDYETLFASALGKYDYADAVLITLQAFLLAPQFHYKLEQGRPIDDRLGLVRLTDDELATRLAYALTGTMPDEDLLTAAAEGRLSDAGALATQAQRLLALPQARQAVKAFHDQWLDITTIDHLERSARLYPGFGANITAAMRESMHRTLAHAFWDEGSLSTLFTSTQVFVDKTLAPIYGLAPPATDGFELVDVDPTGARRAGFLTQAGWLAHLSTFETDDPIHRGLFVKERVLCVTPPSAPANVDLVNIQEPEGTFTSRQRIETITAAGACKACHDTFSPYGYAFGNFDAVGAWRESEKGLPIDATGRFVEGDDAPFDGPVDFMNQLAEREDARACVARQWFRFALGRTETISDGCNLRRIVDRLDASGGDLHEMVLAIVQSDAFRYRFTSDVVATKE